MDEDTAAMSLAERLAQRMDEESVPTATALAQRLGVNQSTVTRWLQGESGVRDDMAAKVAGFLGVTEADVALLSRRARAAKRDRQITAHVRHARDPRLPRPDTDPYELAVELAFTEHPNETIMGIVRRLDDLQERVEALEGATNLTDAAGRDDWAVAADADDPDAHEARPPTDIRSRPRPGATRSEHDPDDSVDGA